MTPENLRAWAAQHAYTYEAAARALGISRSGFAKLISGESRIDLRTDLACAAISAGIEPFSKQSPDSLIQRG